MRILRLALKSDPIEEIFRDNLTEETYELVMADCMIMPTDKAEESLGRYMIK